MKTDDCTWKGCMAPAAHPHTAQDGEVWANLCEAHEAEENAASLERDPSHILRCWVLAQGGAKKAAARMVR
jgi:hypothetical protein